MCTMCYTALWRECESPAAYLWRLTKADRLSKGYTESGQGELVAKIGREVVGARVPGGSEDVLFDLAIRQLYKNYQRATKGAKL